MMIEKYFGSCVGEVPMTTLSCQPDNPTNPQPGTPQPAAPSTYLRGCDLLLHEQARVHGRRVPRAQIVLRALLLQRGHVGLVPPPHQHHVGLRIEGWIAGEYWVDTRVMQSGFSVSIW